MAVPATSAMPARGLTAAEAASRLQARPRRRAPASRSYASIVRANVLTVFNAILTAFAVATLVFGDWRDAMFLAILAANTAIGLAQEIRAKRALDRLALLAAPVATVLRDGRETTVAAEAVVAGDVIRVQAGDEIVADASVVEAAGLRVDESVLTGESEPVSRSAGDAVRSGAFVVEGGGLLCAETVGADSYAERLLGEARSFRHPRSPLQRAVDRLLVATVGLVATLGSMLGYALWHNHTGARESVSTATAGVATLIPEGLMLLVSLVFAVGAARMARRGVLTQQLSAIESLASADVICLDKTGTLTEPTLRVAALVPAPGVDPTELQAAVAAYGASADDHGALIAALGADAPDGAAAPVLAEVPFASQRRWSALRFAERTLVLGAPELLAGGELLTAAREHQHAGRRVVAIAVSDAAPVVGDDPQLPPTTRPLGVIALAEQLRGDARDTVAFLRAQGIRLKVLSGDAPETVAAIAGDAGLPVTRVARGAELPDDPAERTRFAEEVDVVGRMTPEHKADLVAALVGQGHHVVMVGDGVNDVPAMKRAQLAIAQGTGTQMTKSVADLVLVDGNFAAVGPLIVEGRQMLRNLARVAKLYAAKTSFAAFLILTVGISSTAYPLLPRHFSLAATLTIGVPTFVLALAPSNGSWEADRFVRRVAAFAVPAGALIGVGVVASYLFTLHDLDFSLQQSRTTATTVLVICGLYLVTVLDARGRRRGTAIAALCAAMAGCFVAALLLPDTRHFFDLATPSAGMTAAAVLAAGLSIAALVSAGFTPGSGMDDDDH